MFCSFRRWGPKKGMAGATRHTMGLNQLDHGTKQYTRRSQPLDASRLVGVPEGMQGKHLFGGTPSRGERQCLPQRVGLLGGRAYRQALVYSNTAQHSPYARVLQWKRASWAASMVSHFGG